MECDLRRGGALLHTSVRAPRPYNRARELLLEQRNVNAVLGHRSRSAYALTHLAPTKRYQRFA